MYYGKKVYLRALEMDDLDNIMEYWNTWPLRRYLMNQIPFSRLAEKEWLERAVKLNPDRDSALLLAIAEKETGKFLGTTGFWSISSRNRRAELGIAIHNPDYQGKGYGTDAMLVVLWVAFNVLNLHGVQLSTFAFNKRAIRAYEKVNFRKTGVHRQAMFVEGKYHDLVYMDILQEEFFEKYPPGTLVGEP
ncbi:MAG: GNAT family N-acetyltransferase [Candidatus Hodarchaeales archaeon]|jgi:RimJ/RimL family protein N-acetyltransferase